MERKFAIPYKMQFISGILMQVGHKTLHKGCPNCQILTVLWGTIFFLIAATQKSIRALHLKARLLCWMAVALYSNFADLQGEKASRQTVSGEGEQRA